MCLVFTGLGTADMLHLYSRVGTCPDNFFQEKNFSTDPYLRKFMRKNEFDRDMFLCGKFNASILHKSSLMYKPLLSLFSSLSSEIHYGRPNTLITDESSLMYDTTHHLSVASIFTAQRRNPLRKTNYYSASLVRALMRRNRFLWAPEIRERSKIAVEKLIKRQSKNTFFLISQGREWCWSLRWSEKNYKKKLKKNWRRKLNESKI